MFHLWGGRTFSTSVSFKLPGASPIGGRELAQEAVSTHRSCVATDKVDRVARVLETVAVQAISDSAMRVEGQFQQEPVRFLLDSGAAVSVCRYESLPEDLSLDTEPSVYTVGANGLPLDVLGQVTAEVSIGSFITMQDFVVVKGMPVDCLLGADFLLKHGAVIDCKSGVLQVGGHTVSLLPMTSKEPSMVHMEETVEIPARSVMLITGRVIGKPGKPVTDSEGLLEPVGNQGIPKHLLVARSLSDVSSEADVTCQVMNVGPEAVRLYRGTRIAQFTPRASVLLIGNKAAEKTTMDQETSENLADINLDNTDLNEGQKRELLHLLGEFRKLFVSKD